MREYVERNNDRFAQEVEYSSERILSKFNRDPAVADLDEELVQALLRTKYEHWAYEEEVRVFLDLDKQSAEGASYFYEFSTDLVLREVILGPLCVIPVQRVRKLVSGLYDSVDVIKARLAFKFFKVVENKRLRSRSYDRTARAPIS